jgi:hypothetical protein
MFKKTNKKRLTILLVSLSLILVVGVGVTLAYVFDSTGDVVNTFTPSKVTCAVVEDQKTDDAPKGQVKVEDKTNVKIKNTGDTSAYIRAAIIVTWKNSNDVVWAQKPIEGTHYQIDRGDAWALSTDGYYYYVNAINPGDSTLNLIDSIVPTATRPNDLPTDYVLSVEIVASAIQSTPDHVVYDMWGATASNGTITAIPSGTVTTN